MRSPRADAVDAPPLAADAPAAGELDDDGEQPVNAQDSISIEQLRAILRMLRF